jgi:AcrR family transcriptional regulator
MGRPKLHDEQTGIVLLDAAEQLAEREGVGALSVRRLADETGTSTRAVYSVFGSKAGLLDALGARAFDWLARALDAQAPTDDPLADLVEAGASGFRRLVVEHPALFQVGVQRPRAGPGTQTYTAAEQALRRLLARLRRLEQASQLAHPTLEEAAFEFHALCEGLAALELRGSIPVGHQERAWRSALTTLVHGLLATPQRDPASTSASDPLLKPQQSSARTPRVRTARR